MCMCLLAVFVIAFLLEHSEFSVNASRSLQPSWSLTTFATLAHSSMPHFFSCFRITPHCVPSGHLGHRLPSGLYDKLVFLMLPFLHIVYVCWNNAMYSLLAPFLVFCVIPVTRPADSAACARETKY